MIVKEIRDILPGSVRTFFCSNSELIINTLESTFQPNVSDFNIAFYLWAEIPFLDYILNDILGSLAGMALKMWPRWYGGNLEPDVTTTPEGRGSGKWLEKAALLCRENLNPLPPWLFNVDPDHAIKEIKDIVNFRRKERSACIFILV